MHKLTANTDSLTEVEASQQGSTDLEIRAEQIAIAAMGELWQKSLWLNRAWKYGRLSMVGYLSFVFQQ